MTQCAVGAITDAGTSQLSRKANDMNGITSEDIRARLAKACAAALSYEAHDPEKGWVHIDGKGPQDDADAILAADPDLDRDAALGARLLVELDHIRFGTTRD